jgi:membrane protease YdiL (CAAX protease family)
MTSDCLKCGKPLNESEAGAGLFCASCASVGSASEPGLGLEPGQGWDPSGRRGPIGSIAGSTAGSTGDQERSGDPSETGQAGQAYYGAYDQYGGYQRPPDFTDPDRPPWGLGAAIVVWLASVASIIIFPNISVLAWLLYERAKGLMIPTDRDQLEALFRQPKVTLIVVSASLAAHIVTLAIIWAVVTGLGRRSVWRAPEWKWNWSNPLAKFVFVVGIVILMFAAEAVLSIFLPESKETDFDRLLKGAGNVRFLIAFVAVFSAPLVEEWVYRGVLYGGLRRVASMWPSVLVVALLFAGVHVPQYLGSWVGMASISVLSLTLTLIRAKTRSILPCIAVHVLFNTISSVFILSHHY